jgi:Spy/CpxP family protein refolding chaperone
MKKTIASFALTLMFATSTPCQEPPPPPLFSGPENGPSVAMTHSAEGGFRMMVRARGGDWWRDPRFVKELALSGEQVRKIEKIAYDHHMHQIDLRADVEKQELLLNSTMAEDSPDEAQVLAQFDRLSQARAALDKSGIAMQLAIRRVLTPEQAKKLRDQMPPPDMAGPEMMMPPMGGPETLSGPPE